MPWTNTVDQRYAFVCECLKGTRTMTALCERYGISRRVGYKWLKRFKEGGRAALEDQRRRPRSSPTAMSVEVEGALVALRRQHPTWGPKKLCKRLAIVSPRLKIPAPSTVGRMLKRRGLVDEAKSLRQRRAANRKKLKRRLAESEAPNDVWCIDFKGEFRLGDRSLCYPVTITDHFSRYVIACVGQSSPDFAGVETTLVRAFRRYGLPRFVRSDNGPPFGGDGLLGLSYLSVWLMRLGIQPEHIDPGRPDQNGRHERMHRCLKAETARPPRETLGSQQRAFDRWRRCFNNKRPHEGIGLVTPGSLYERSARRIGQPKSPTYPGHVEIARVQKKGHFHWKGADVFVGAAFRGEPVALEEVDEEVWLVRYAELHLGLLLEEDLNERRWVRLRSLQSWR